MAATSRMSHVGLEILRLFVVVFGAAIGNEVAGRIGSLSDDTALSAVNVRFLGTVVGALTGYVVGGVAARIALRSLDRGERAFDGLQSDQLVAGTLGGVVAAAGAALVSWPLLLLGAPLVVGPVFAFVVVIAAMFGFRMGRTRREAVLGGLGGRAGARSGATSTMPRIVDTSVAIDGRILDVVRSGFLHGRFIVPQPVIDEMQSMADAAEEHRRAKGRRGLEVLETLRREQGVDLQVIGDEAPGEVEVDAKLVRISLDRGAALLTLDTNLARAASLGGVRVLNLHQLALALRPPVVVGDDVYVHLLKAGRENGQAVGYLDDGTMVVAEGARDRLGDEVAVVVTSVLTTANGRMIFARLAGAPAVSRR